MFQKREKHFYRSILFHFNSICFVSVNVILVIAIRVLCALSFFFSPTPGPTAPGTPLRMPTTGTIIA